MKHWVIQFDGACRPSNPGTATFGWVIYSPDGSLYQRGKGTAEKGKISTSNIAEYAGLLDSLEYMQDEGLVSIPLHIQGDSKLVVEQVNKRWKCRKPHLAVWRDKVLTLLKIVGNPWKLQWMSRENNKLADKLSTSICLD